MTTTTIKNYNIAPYHDDYDEKKGFQRILFRPGYSVQARELTQMQTAIQAQIDRHGQYAFRDGDRVIDGHWSTNFDYDYIKLVDTFTHNGADYVTSNYLEEFVGTTITGTANSTNQVIAKVLEAIPAGPSEDFDGDEPITLYIQYIENGGENHEVGQFAHNELIVSSGQPIGEMPDGSPGLIPRAGKIGDGVSAQFVDPDGIPDTIGKGSKVDLEEGVYFVAGNFVYVEAQSLILAKYNPYPSYQVGLSVVESIVTSQDDYSLLDNASGAPNESAPGAHRHAITLTLVKDNYDTVLSEGDERYKDKIVFLKVYGGAVETDAVSGEQEKGQTELSKRLARRTYDESGNYSVTPYQIDLTEHLDNGRNNGYRKVEDGGEYNKINIAIEPSDAYVDGFRIAHSDVSNVEIDKPRSEADRDEVSTLIVNDYGNFIEIQASTALGLPDIDNYTTIELKTNTTNDSTGVIGTARIREIEFVEDDAADYYKVFLFDIVTTTNFNDVRSIRQSGKFFGILGVDGLQAVSGVRHETRLNSLIFQLPRDVVRHVEIDGYQVRQTGWATVTAEGTAAISINGGVLDNVYDIITSINDGAPSHKAPSSNVGEGALTFSGLTPGDRIDVIYTVNKFGSFATNRLRSKTYLEEQSPNSAVLPIVADGSSSYNLGYADVAAVRSVINIDGIDITHKFLLDPGQRDNFYDLSKLIVRPGETITDGELTILIDYFQHGVGDYFTADSYYNPDLVPEDYDEIHKYMSIPSINSIKGQLELRDCIDFRPTMTVNGLVGGDTPRNNTLTTAAMSHWLGRIDKLYITASGEFGTVTGVPALNPEIPKNVEGSMVLYQIDIPPFVFSVDAIGLDMFDNRRYTMRDIGKLEKRIKTLEYYTSLSLIEQSTADTELFDGNGASRFKNGFIVDGFYGHNMANVEHPDYAVAIDKELGVLRPKFVEDNIGLIRNPSDTGKVTSVEDICILPYEHAVLIDQTRSSYAEWVNPYNIVSWEGTMKLSPSSDEWKETKIRPAVIINNDAHYNQLVASAQQNGILGTVWNGWQTAWTGTEILGSSSTSPEWSKPATKPVSTTPNPVPVPSKPSPPPGPVVVKTDPVPPSQPTKPPEEYIIPAPKPTPEPIVLPKGAIGFTDKNGFHPTGSGSEYQIPTGMWPGIGSIPININIGPFGGTRTGISSFPQPIIQKKVPVTTTVTGMQTTRQTRSGLVTRAVPSTTTVDQGSKVVEVNIIPFMRSRTISFKAEMLKPKTQVYAFFNGVNVSSYCDGDAEFTSFSQGSVNEATNDKLNGNLPGENPGFNAPLITDSAGRIEGTFRIPRNDNMKFKTGSRVFKLTDDPTNRELFETTMSANTYTASGILETTQRTIISTKTPRWVTTAVADHKTFTTPTTTTTVKYVTQPVVVPAPQPPVLEVTDPIVQPPPPPPPEPPVIPVPPPPPPVPEPTPPPEPPPPPPPPPPAPVIPEPIVIPNVANWPFAAPWGSPDVGSNLRIQRQAARRAQTCWKDPLAQTILIDEPSGLFVTSVQLFFAAKDDSLPVNISIRTCENGIPTQEIVPGTEVVLYPNNIVVSDDSTVATPFYFDNPVYLTGDTEFAIVIMSNSDVYKVYVATMGDLDITDPEYRISSQPHQGVFFTSQNASTWTPDQNKDLKFRLTRAVFNTLPQTVEFQHEIIPEKLLEWNPLLFVRNNGANCDIRIAHGNHGMNSEFDQVVISGAFQEINGIPFNNLNGVHTIREQELDSYLITVTGNCTVEGVDDGGHGIYATENRVFNTLNIIAQSMEFPAATIDYKLRTMSGKSVDNTSEIAYEMDQNWFDIEVNRNLEFANPRLIPNPTETSQPIGLYLQGTFNNHGNDFISPVIDTERLSAITIGHRLNDASVVDQLSQLEYDNVDAGRMFVDEISPMGGSNLSKYITKRVDLNTEAEVITAYLNVSRPTGSNVDVYYKTMEAGSEVDFDYDIDWILAPPDKAIPEDNSGLYTEAMYSLTPAGMFASFAFKIVFRSTSSSAIPKCSDFRAIAST